MAQDKIYVNGKRLDDGSAEFYDKWAGSYDTDVDGFHYSGYKSVVSKWEEYYASALEGYQVTTGIKHKVLDAGCGTGLVCEFFSTKSFFQAIEIYGTDYSEKMLEEAKAKNVYFALKQVDLKQELPYDPEYFDSIVIAGVFCINHIVPKDLPNIVKVLKPEGYLFGTVNKKFYEAISEEWDWKNWITKSGCTLVEDIAIHYRDEAEGVLFVLRKN